MLHQDAWLCLLVWCKACFRQSPADLRAIIDVVGRGDVPLKDLRFRCCTVAATNSATLNVALSLISRRMGD
jgi:hypothetical protein